MKVKRKLVMLLSITALLFVTTSVWGQSVKVQKVESFEESEALIIDPKQDVYIVPLIAEIEIMDNQKRGEYGPYYFDVLSNRSINDPYVLESYKSRALYLASKDANADLIVAAMLNVKNEVVGGKEQIVVRVSGYPGKYVKFRSAKSDDVEWIRKVYPAGGYTKEEGASIKGENTTIIQK